MEVIVETGNERNLNLSPDMSINRMKLKRLDSLMKSESSYLFETSSSPNATLEHSHVHAKEFSTKSEDFAVPECASQPLVEFCMVLEPYGAKTVKGGELRREAFGIADTNGTGQLSFAEMDNFILHLLMTKYGGRSEKAEDLFRLFRPCYLYAFNNVKKLQKNDGKVFKGAKTATADDYISFPEFRVFTVSLRIHAAMFDIFCTIDGGTMKKTHGHDARISLEEFVKSFSGEGTTLDKVKYGFNGLDGLLSSSTSPSEEDVTALFHKIDANKGGYILLSEWFTYLKQEEIAANTHMGVLLSGNLKPIRLPISPLKSPSSSVASSPRQRSSSGARYNRKRINTATTLTTATTMSSSVMSSMDSSILMSSITNKASKASWKKLSTIMPVTVAGAYRPNETAATEDLRKFIQSFQPYAEKYPTSIALRKADFSTCDSNGSGNCSLAEIHNYVSWVLKQDYGSDEGLRIFWTFRPAFIAAYNGAKNIKKNARNACNGNKKSNMTEEEEDCIGFAEFRILNAYLCIYAGMLDAFQLIDGNGAGVDENDDRRIQKDEWMKGYAEFNKEDDVILEGDEDTKSYTSTSSNHNFVAFSKVTDDQAALAAFEDMDADSGGVVRFSEFCDWIAKEELSRKTPLGKLLKGSSLQTEKLYVREWRNSR